MAALFLLSFYYRRFAMATLTHFAKIQLFLSKRRKFRPPRYCINKPVKLKNINTIRL